MFYLFIYLFFYRLWFFKGSIDVRVLVAKPYDWDIKIRSDNNSSFQKETTIDAFI